MDMNKMLTQAVLCCVVLAISSQALKLPSYIKPCFRNRPDFSECALKNSVEGVAGIVAGDRKYRIPKFEPLLIDKTEIRTPPGPIDITVRMTDIQLYGHNKTDVRRFDVDFDKHLISYDIFMPRMEVIANYNMTGKILILPVTGTGKSNVTFVNSLTTYTVGYTLTTKSDGKEYMVMGDVGTTMDADRIYTHFDNLFNGNKQLGDQLNNIIDENWKEMFKEISPAFNQVNAEISKSMLSYVFENIPYYDVFPEEGRSS